MSRFIVQLQPTDEGVAEVVGPVEAVFAVGRSSRRVSAEKTTVASEAPTSSRCWNWTTVSRKLLRDVEPAGELQSTAAT